MSLRSACCAVVAALLALLPRSSVSAPRPAAALPPAKPLPAPPTLPRIRVEVARDHVLVVEDVLIRRGGWTAGDLDAFVAFGAPGVPRAFDARLYAAANDDDDVAEPDSFTVIPVERAFRRPVKARQLLGPPAMAGAVLHLRDPWFGRALAATGTARVRIRTLLDPPSPDAQSGREILVRLGSHLGEPDALDAIEIASVDPRLSVSRALARLCGPDADPYPLVVRGVQAFAAAVAPVLSVRHATDDLCVRYWTAPSS